MAHFRTTRLLPILVGGLALLLSACGDKAATARTARVAASGPTSRTITVKATGKANAIPDQLVARLAVHTSGPTATGVMADANGRAKAVLDQVEQQGVAAKDVKTTQVNLGPTFDQKGAVTGFAADNAIEVTFRRLAIAGRQLDAVVRTPGDAARLESVTLGFNDDDKVLAAARTDGVRRARSQARQMVGALDANLGAVRTITESSDPQGFGAVAASRASSASDASVPIAPGTQARTVDVRVVFEIG